MFNKRAVLNNDTVFSGPWIVAGNTAKVKVICELADRLTENTGIVRILDIGCVGLQPLQVWVPLLELYSNFELVGVDVWGIEEARNIAREQGWMRVHFHEGSGYHLTQLFPPASFDIVVATQVLEHVFRPLPFMQQIASVLRPDGEVFLTVDSAHWKPRFTLRDPLRFIKNVTKKVLAVVGNESHYDLPWYDHEITTFAERAGLEVVCCRYYNVHPLKYLHNHATPDSVKNDFMKQWFTLEELQNTKLLHHEKHFFMGLYIHLRRSRTR